MTTAIDNAKARTTKNLHGPNRCLENVRECFGLAAAGDEPTAWAAWLKEGGHDGPNTHYALHAPANVPGFFQHGTDGHVVVCVGDGTCYSTDFDGKRWVMDGKMHHVTISSLVAAGMKWAGWTETLEHKRVHPHVG